MTTTLNTSELKDLTLSQLEVQYDAINTARFLMERSFLASEETVNELLHACMALQEEIESRK